VGLAWRWRRPGLLLLCTPHGCHDCQCHAAGAAGGRNFTRVTIIFIDP
jgi:hypothetical protein